MVVAGFAPEPGGEGAAANDERVLKEKNGSAAAETYGTLLLAKQAGLYWRC